MKDEAEGFEPPVPVGTLAFKVVDPLISGDRPDNMGMAVGPSVTTAGPTDHR